MNNVYPEPVWTFPQEALEPCSSFFYVGPSPFSLTGVFLRLLQYHFSTPDNIEEPLLKDYIWSPSDKGCLPTTDYGASSSEESSVASQVVPGSRLLIRTSYSQDPAAAQQLPGLYVKREAFYTEGISLLDRSLPGLNSRGVYEGTEHQVNVIGAHSLICRGGSGAEADLLGQEVYFRMLHYQQVIKKDFQLGRLQAKSVSEVRQQPEQAKSAYYSVVRMEWAYVYRWLVIPEAPILKRLTTEFIET